MAKIWSVKAACQPPATVLSTGNNRPLLPRNPLRIKTRFRNYRGRHLEGIAMNSSLASTDFSKARRATEPSNEPLLQPAARNLITRARLRLGKLVSFAFARHLMMFFIGVAATLAWQSYSGAARKAIASWSPHLAWVAPTAARGGPSPEQLKATSVALAAARQSIDKLSSELRKLTASSEKKARSSRRGQGT